MGTATAGRAKITKKQIVYLQVTRRKSGITDDLWQEMKRSVGVTSTRDLDQERMNALLARMGSGGKPVGAAPRGRPSEANLPPGDQRGGRVRQWKPAPDKARMVAKIEAILVELQLPMSYADGIARQMFGVDSLRFCDGDQTFRVLQGLMVYHKRQLGRRAACAKKGDVK